VDNLSPEIPSTPILSIDAPIEPLQSNESRLRTMFIPQKPSGFLDQGDRMLLIGLRHMQLYKPAAWN
jgi:hypothetical protein